MTETPETYLLKDIFNRGRLEHIGRSVAAMWPGFDTKRFMRLATKEIDTLGIMQRMRQVATSLRETLPGGFQRNVDILTAAAQSLDHAFAAISFSEYVALYGADDFDASMRALNHLTRFGSSEFAIRPFLVRDLRRTIAVMERWADDENEHVRRLASEGSRPRLPWSFQIRALIDDPSPVAPILDALNADPSLYVRKSVANHLNDITKTDPDWVLSRLDGWPMADAHTQWIARHALRTLIKRGDQRALSVIGAGGKARLGVEHFAVLPAKIDLGDRIRIAARLASASTKPQRLVVDYAIHYVKKNGTVSRKVFKLKECDLAPGTSLDLAISQVVRDFTTRKHFPGHHRVELIANGAVVATSGFDLSV